MPKINVFLEKNIIQNLKNLSKESGKSLSKTAAELVELGYKIKQLQNKKPGSKEEKLAELAGKNTEYLLKLLAITSDIFRCTRNAKSKYKSNETEDAINEIRAQVQAYIEGFVGEDQ